MRRTHVRWGRVGVLSTIALAGVALLSGQAGSQPERTPAKAVYQVRPGDTVWEIAGRLAGPAGDPRPIVDSLIAANHLRGATISVGDRLVIDTTD